MSDLNLSARNDEAHSRREPIDTTAQILSLPLRPFLSLISTHTDPERVCMILRQRIAEYAHKISGAPGLSISNLQPDEMVTGIIGESKLLGGLDIADLVQAYIGVYIYDQILLSTISYESLCKLNWEHNLETWLCARLNLNTLLRAHDGLQY